MYGKQYEAVGSSCPQGGSAEQNMVAGHNQGVVDTLAPELLTLFILYTAVSAVHKHKMHSSCPDLSNSDIMKYVKQDILIIMLALIVQHGWENLCR